MKPRLMDACDASGRVLSMLGVSQGDCRVDL